MELICRKIDEIWRVINHFKLYEKLYILTLIFFSMYIGFSKYFGTNTLVLILAYLTIFTVTIAIILQIVEVVKVLWKKTYIKWVTGIILIFISLYTDSMTRIKIYNYVHVNPDNYSTAINALDAIYIYLYFLIFLISVVLLIILVMPFMMILLEMLANMLNIFPKLSKKIEGFSSKSWKMLIPMLGAIYLIAMYFLVFQKKIYTFETRGVPKIILAASYYPNTTCVNKELKNKYIKLLGVSGKVSVSNVSIGELVINTPMDILINLPRLDKNIEFHTTICITKNTK